MTQPLADERREGHARIIDPSPFTAHAAMIVFCQSEGDSLEVARRYADDTYGQSIRTALSKADAIIAAEDARVSGPLTGEGDPRLIVAQWMTKTTLDPVLKTALNALLRSIPTPTAEDARREGEPLPKPDQRLEAVAREPFDRAVHLTEQDVLEFIWHDAPTLARVVHPGLDVLDDIDTGEPIGWRIYGWSKRAPAAAISAWRPIEVAPKDQRVMLWFPTLHRGTAVFGYWNPDTYAKKPRPYWTMDKERSVGVAVVRANQPTHWSLPSQPDPGPARQAALTVEGGDFVSVPREPTEAMIAASKTAWWYSHDASHASAYRAMIEAAPSVSSPSKGGGE